jgi:hypothetical protein
MALRTTEPVAASAFLRNVQARLIELDLLEGHAAELAPRLEAEALRYVRAFVPGPLVVPVMASRELAEEWPLHSALRFGESEACAALASWVLDNKHHPAQWHPSVSRDDIAGALERATGEDADVAGWIAGKLRADTWAIFDSGRPLADADPRDPYFNFRSPSAGFFVNLRSYDEDFWMGFALQALQADELMFGPGAPCSYPHDSRDAAAANKAAALFRAGRWFDVRAVALVVVALRRARTVSEPLEAYRFAVRTVRLLCEGEVGGNSTRSRVVSAAIDRARSRVGIDPGAYGDALPRELDAELRAHVAAISEALPPDAEGPTDDSSARALFSRMNEAFAGRAEAIGRGGAGAELAADARGQSLEGQALWRLWAAEDGQVPGCRFAVFLGYALLLDVVIPRLVARPLGPTGVRVRDDSDLHAVVPVIVAPASWGIGGGAKARAELGEFAVASNVPASALLPKSAALLSHRDHPTQGVLALGLEASDEPLPVIISRQAGGQDEVLSMVAGKAALLFLSSSHMRKPGVMCRGTLGGLARTLYPGAAKGGRIQARELEATAEALRQLNSLYLFLPDGRQTPIFGGILSPAAHVMPKADTEIVVTIAQTFHYGLAKLKEGRPEYGAGFLFNLDGVMRLDNRNPRPLRYYLRAAADWNKARRDPARMQPMSIEEMAARANTLPPKAVEALEAKRGKSKAQHAQSVALYEARKSAVKDLEQLHERGLVVLKAAGQGEYRVLPPADYLEAHRQHTTDGARQLGPAGGSLCLAADT